MKIMSSCHHDLINGWLVGGLVRWSDGRFVG